MIFTENRTDLAVESYESADKTKIDGVRVTQDGGVTTVEVLSENGEREIGKPIGRYITVSVPSFVTDNDIFDGRLDRLAAILKSLLPENCRDVLAAGIGNLDITADALGPKSMNYVLATRHLKNEKFFSGFTSVSSVQTGVLGDTGIESAELVRGIVNQIHPSCVIAVDALAASCADRLGTTVQLSDTGIAPGSGVGNHRYEISAATLGVPVVSIGIPTVISASAFSGGDGEQMFVTPREIDRVIEHGSKLIGMAVNVCLQSGISATDLFSLVG